MNIGNFVEAFLAAVAVQGPLGSKPPLVAHIIHRLAVGGLENGLVNLINATPSDRYRHAVICLTEYTDFRNRIRQPHVPVIALHKREGKDFRTHLRLRRVLRELRPAIVHTRNLPALEFLAVAAFAGVRGRIHGEHGRDVYDLYGTNRKYNFLRKALDPFTSCYTAVSNDLARWLVQTVGVAAEKVLHISNGVDIHRFRPRCGARSPVGPTGFVQDRTILLGTVGRMQTVKDQLTLVRAFVHLLEQDPKARDIVRLVMIGDGPLRDQSLKILQTAGIDHLAWLPGERSDIPELLRALDLFVLPSLGEGISNTILEAMSSSLPVIATRVGGNPELVEEGRTGLLVPVSDPVAMSAAIRVYLRDSNLLLKHGQAGRERVERKFSFESMVNGYMGIYDRILMTQRDPSQKAVTRVGSTRSCPE